MIKSKKKFIHYHNKIIYKSFLFFFCVVLGSCKDECQPIYHEKEICKTKKDFQNLTCPPKIAQVRKKKKCGIYKNPLPEFCYTKVCLCLTGKIPISEAFFELGRQAGINICIDRGLKHNPSLFYQANDQPFIEVLDNLCALSHARYYFSNNMLHICDDDPHMKTHNVQFLLGVRKTKTQTSVKTDIFAEGLRHRGGNTTGQENGASFAFNTDNVVDFWEELDRNISMILRENPQKKNYRPSFSINRYAGFISVHGTERQHRL